MTRSERMKTLAEKFGKSSTSATLEFVCSAWPFLLGALALRDFQLRQWPAFFFGLGVAGFLAVSSFRLHRFRRKCMEEQQCAIRGLVADNEKLAEFFTAMMTGRGTGLVKVVVSKRPGEGPRVSLEEQMLTDIPPSLNPEFRRDKMN